MRLWRPAGGGRQTDIRPAPAGSSLRLPASPRPGWASSLQPGPWGAPAGHCSQDWDSCLFPPPGLQGALPEAAEAPPASAGLRTWLMAPAESLKRTQPQAGPRKPLQPPRPPGLPQRSHLVPSGGGGQGSHPEYKGWHGAGDDGIWRVGLRTVSQNSASGVLTG